MKNLMTIMMLALLGIVLTVTSCKKDDDEDNSVPTNINYSKGFIQNWGQWGNAYNFDITMATSGIDFSNFSGKGHIVYFELFTDSVIFNGGTFTYNSNESAGSFHRCNLVINANLNNMSGTNFLLATNGTITLTKSDENYSINYTITAQEYESDYYENPIGEPTTMTGSYNGPLSDFYIIEKSNKNFFRK